MKNKETRSNDIVYHPQHRVGVIQASVGAERYVVFAAAEDQWVHGSELVVADYYFLREQHIQKRIVRHEKPEPTTSTKTSTDEVFDVALRLSALDKTPPPPNYVYGKLKPIELPSINECPNLRSAWSDDAGSLHLFRCYCPKCLAERAQITPATPYVGSKRRCRICKAVDGVPYPKHLKSLWASKRKEICELFRGLCNRPQCERIRRLPGEFPETQYYPHGKGSYPLGLVDNETPIHPDLIDWAQNLLPSDGNSLSGWGRNGRYGSKIEYKPKDPPKLAAEVRWRNESAEWKSLEVIFDGGSRLDFGDPPNRQRQTHRLETYKNANGIWKARLVADDTFHVVGIGTRKTSPLSGLEAERRRDAYNDQQVVGAHRGLVQTLPLRLAEPCDRSIRYGKPIVLCFLNQSLDEKTAARWDEKYRKKHPYGQDEDFLPRAALYGENIGGVKQADESLSEFYARWAYKLNPEGLNWQEVTPERIDAILKNPEFKRAYAQYLIEFHDVRVNELEPDENPNTFAKRLWRELQNPLNSITEKNLADSFGRLGIAVILNNRATVKVIVPPDAPMSQMLNLLDGEKAKSMRTAAKNAKQVAKCERLGKRATKDAIDDAVRRVEQAYNDADNAVKFLYANSSTTSEL